MANESGGGSGGMWVALIGLITTVSGGVFANWDRIFPPSDPDQVMAAQPPEAGAAADAVSDPGDAASQPDAADSESAAEAAEASSAP
ncbi:MAG: hypothetical protein ACT6S0_16265 [Roseateles sp.]|uniref:hypothetical protein n=1 Tax=Roseateles sp. TaxID=1971397 RepID=UPI004035E7D1